MPSARATNRDAVEGTAMPGSVAGDRPERAIPVRLTRDVTGFSAKALPRADRRSFGSSCRRRPDRTLRQEKPREVPGSGRAANSSIHHRQGDWGAEQPTAIQIGDSTSRSVLHFRSESSCDHSPTGEVLGRYAPKGSDDAPSCAAATTLAGSGSGQLRPWNGGWEAFVGTDGPART